jgi:hypothetical protein
MPGIGGAGGYTIRSDTFELSPGLLTAVNLAVDKRYDGWFLQYWSFGITSPLRVTDGSVITLAQGFCQYPNGLSWSGFFELYEGDFIWANTVGNVLQTGFLSYRRLIPDVQGGVFKYAKFLFGSS